MPSSLDCSIHDWRNYDTDARRAMSKGDVRYLLRLQREELKVALFDVLDSICECCDRAAGIDLHEVFVRRSALPLIQQHTIFTFDNCALVCIACHRADLGQQPLAETPAFMARFKRRRERLRQCLLTQVKTLPRWQVRLLEMTPWSQI
jgi:uncharacterized Fe-S radical SAM superfamily protein PflX